MNIEEIHFPNDETKAWVLIRFYESGPWNLKPTLQSKLNCLLNYHLSGLGTDALYVRGYLCNEDTPEVWKQSIENMVLPYIGRCLMELCHG